MSINGYHFSHRSPEPAYKGKNKPHAFDLAEAGNTELEGVEYELSFADYYDLDVVSEKLQAAMGKTETENGRLKCERDSSVVNGFECISYPATFGCHMQCYGWDKFFEVLSSYSTRGTETGNNGMHVHVSRASLGNTDQARELCIAKLIFMLDHFTTMFGKIAGRSYARCHWCECNNAGIETTDKSAVAIYKAKLTSGNRYKALNLTNTATVEFRIFAVDNRLDHFKARLQFVHWLVGYCKGHTIDVIYAATPATIKNEIRALDAEKYGELIALVNEIYAA